MREDTTRRTSSHPSLLCLPTVPLYALASSSAENAPHDLAALDESRLLWFWSRPRSWAAWLRLTSIPRTRQTSLPFRRI